MCIPVNIFAGDHTARGYAAWGFAREHIAPALVADVGAKSRVMLPRKGPCEGSRPCPFIGVLQGNTARNTALRRGTPSGADHCSRPEESGCQGRGEAT